MANNKIQINIAGISLIISTPEDETYVLKLAEMMERDMQTVLSENSSASIANSAILCAIDYLDRYHKANRSAANMRAQIKEYLTDAANAKLLYDGEKKRADTLAEEHKTLRAQMNRIPTELPAKQRDAKDEIVASPKELEALRQDYETVTAQCQNLTDRIRALNDYITNQDNEIMRLKALESEQLNRISSQSGQISELENDIVAKQREIDRLIAELHEIERLVADDMAASKNKPNQTYRGAKQNQKPPSRSFTLDSESGGEMYDHFSGNFDATIQAPPPRYSEPGDNEDMPNLNWTKDV